MACGATLSLKRSLEFDPLHSPSSRSPKRRRCIPMTLSPATPPTKPHHTNPSPFTEFNPKLTSDQIAAQISAEIRRMQRRKQLNYQSGSSDSPSSSPSHSGCSTPPHLSSSLHPADITAHMTCNPLSPTRKDTPLFSLRQVGFFCERMLKEREEAIREEYDKVLNGKLAEQYEAFLKFNHDQLARRAGERPASYVS